MAGAFAISLGGASTGSAQTMAVGVDAKAAELAAVTVDVVNAPLSQVLQSIVRQAKLRATWDEKVLDSGARVTVHLREVSASEAFTRVLSGTGMRAKVSRGDVVILREGADAVANGVITGSVIDAKTKRPLRGATITLDNTKIGTTSGDDGKFRISNVSVGEHTMHVRMLAYVKAVRTVTVTDDNSTAADVALESSINTLDQVVVTGTVVPTELKAVPNAMTVITAKDIEQRGITHIDQLFRGDVPGLFVQNAGAAGGVGGGFTMYSRGATAFTNSSSASNGTTPIKTYVDGVELASAGRTLAQIDPRSIERIEILTGPQASTIYGSNAINGVMQIFTKRGTTPRPLVTLDLQSGVVQNNFSSALTPVHADNGAVTGMEGRISYNVGGSWDYTGPWTPGLSEGRASGYGGARMQFSQLMVDANFRSAVTHRRVGGSLSQVATALVDQGIWAPSSTCNGCDQPAIYTMTGQTMGATVTYTPVSWWSHTIVLGSDGADYSFIRKPSYMYSYDTTYSMYFGPRSRVSQAYNTTLQIPIATTSHVTLTVGGDHWRTQASTIFPSGAASSYGSLRVSTFTRARPDKNSGAFIQGQWAIWDHLFMTYGLRAEWNPNYGADVQPNMAPRYGIAYARDIGSVTVKLRGSYGRSTRPPTQSDKKAEPMDSPDFIALYGPFNNILANPDLAPEFQQGGEGGLEIYAGTRGSVSVTRYNQTVDGLVVMIPGIDSVRSLLPYPPMYMYSGVLDANGYGYYRQYQNLNVGSIRNQGWELKGTINTGPFTHTATYSWTKSRIIGVAPSFRDRLRDYPEYAVGASFSFLPEHTMAFGTTYARAGTTVSINVSGTGFLYRDSDALSQATDYSIRLRSNAIPRTSMPFPYRATAKGYALADLNASHRLSSHVDVVLQMQNATNSYHNDESILYPSMGRQTRVGVRTRW